VVACPVELDILKLHLLQILYVLYISTTESYYEMLYSLNIFTEMLSLALKDSDKSAKLNICSGGGEGGDLFQMLPWSYLSPPSTGVTCRTTREITDTSLSGFFLEQN
jgi:hypothetical protein